MATDADVGSLIDDEVLERELQQATKSEGEIELFKTVNKSMDIRGELAETATVRQMMSLMWTNVADFFEAITEIESLALLPADHPLVTKHQLMLANFKCVGAINAALVAGREAEGELRAMDHMDHEINEDEL